MGNEFLNVFERSCSVSYIFIISYYFIFYVLKCQLTDFQESIDENDIIIQFNIFAGTTKT